MSYCQTKSDRTRNSIIAMGKKDEDESNQFCTGIGDGSDRRYNTFLLLVAGLGGLLYGIDVGIIGGAYPYLGATRRIDAGTAFGDCGGGAAGQRVLDTFCGDAGRLDGPQAADDSERPDVCR